MAQPNAYGVVAHAALDQYPTPPSPVSGNYLDPGLPIFFAVEVETYTPASGTFTYTYGHGTHAHGTQSLDTQTQAASNFIYASDTGYRTLPTDDQGVVVYPGRFDPSTFALDRGLNLDPSSALPSVSRGTVNLINVDGDYDTLAATTNCDRRQLNILAGNKQWDQARQIWLDPSYQNLIQMFGGLAGPWYCDENALQIPVRDGQYWLTKPIQTTLYGGTGGTDGSADLAGQPVPMVRGGTTALPVMNVSAVLIDPVNLVYQYTDGPGTIINLREGGLKGSIAYAGDVSNLYSGSTPAGQYRSCNALGLFQLGSNPVNTITVECTGSYPVSGPVATAMEMAWRLMLEDANMPAGYVDIGSFIGADAAYPYTAGYSVGNTPVAASVILGTLLQSCGAKLIPSRDGVLRCVILGAIASGAQAEASYGPEEIVTLTAQPLGATLDPPPYRYRVSYQENNTLQTQGYNTTISAAQKSFIAQQYRYQTWINTATLLAYNDPNDPDPVNGYLLDPAGATVIAGNLGALWGVKRYLFAVTLPIVLALRHDIGSILNLTFPFGPLAGGALGTIVREQIRPDQGTSTFYVVV